MIAALFVQPGGVYFGLPGVDPWDEERDARRYAGPWPVVAHPPCARWCRLAGLVEARYGIKRGEDGGVFAFALQAVRRWGGVLEHPAYSDAWLAHGLIDPPRSGWSRVLDGGWVCQVNQSSYGHPAQKATWLYAFGIASPPRMRWGLPRDRSSMALVSWCGNHTKLGDTRRRLLKWERSRTPEPFRDLLLSIARSAQGSGVLESKVMA